MNWYRSLCITAAVAAGLAGTVPIAGTAAADFGTKMDPAITLGGGAFPCVGYVRAHYDPAQTFHGRQAVWLRAEFQLPSVPPSGCVTDVTLSWRNIDTAETGGNPRPVALRDVRPDQRWVPFPLGRHRGHYQILIGTDMPHVAGSGEITVPR